MQIPIGLLALFKKKLMYINYFLKRTRGRRENDARRIPKRISEKIFRRGYLNNKVLNQMKIDTRTGGDI